MSLGVLWGSLIVYDPQLPLLWMSYVCGLPRVGGILQPVRKASKGGWVFTTSPKSLLFFAWFEGNVCKPGSKWVCGLWPKPGQSWLSGQLLGLAFLLDTSFSLSLVYFSPAWDNWTMESLLGGITHSPVPVRSHIQRSVGFGGHSSFIQFCHNGQKSFLTML